MFQIASAGVAPEVPAHLSDGCKRFLARCFCVNPAERASARALLSDPWIATAAVPFAEGGGGGDAGGPARGKGIRMDELRGRDARLSSTA